MSGPASHAAFRRVPRSGFVLLLWAAVLFAPRALEAQGSVVRRNVATLPFEHGLIVIDAHSDGKVVIGASAGDSTIATPLPAAEVKLWADSTARLLARRVPKSVKQRVYRSGIVNRETSAGISFTRRISAGKSSYSLFFANSDYGGFPLGVSRAEADQFVKALRRSVKTARELSTPPRSKRR
ncbi:MAG TPA: hypothetical protein VFK04_12205 [Gemmatimonadaceae bacterium]|jgi:hypothetical protein|nr:hypothetical protein [Gemmatimonadaceae bacterium]